MRTISRCQNKKFSDVSLASRFSQAGEVGYCPWIHPPPSPPKWLRGAARRCADVGNERTWAARTHVPGAGWASCPSLARSPTQDSTERGTRGGREHEQHDRQGIAPLALQPPGPIEGDPCRPKVRWTIRVPGSMHVSVEQSMGSHGDEIDHDGQCHDTPDHPRRQNKMPSREYGRMEGKMTRRRREWCQLGQSRRGKRSRGWVLGGHSCSA